MLPVKQTFRLGELVSLSHHPFLWLSYYMYNLKFLSPIATGLLKGHIELPSVHQPVHQYDLNNCTT